MAKPIIAVSGLEGCGCGPQRSLGQNDGGVPWIAWAAVLGTVAFIWWATVGPGSPKPRRG